MNVDILESNPHWYYYLPFAVGTTALTLLVWIVFKMNENVSTRIPENWDSYHD